MGEINRPNVVIDVRAIYGMINYFCVCCFHLQIRYRVDHLIRCKIQQFRGETTLSVQQLNIYVRKVMR